MGCPSRMFTYSSANAHLGTQYPFACGSCAQRCSFFLGVFSTRWFEISIRTCTDPVFETSLFDKRSHKKRIEWQEKMILHHLRKNFPQLDFARVGTYADHEAVNQISSVLKFRKVGVPKNHLALMIR